MINTNKKSKTAIILLAVTAVLCLGLAVGFIAKSFKSSPEVKVEAPSTATDENGDILNDGEIHPMPAKMMFARAPMLAAENAAESNSAITAKIAANISPYNATNKKVDWAISFVNESSEWAKGKTVTDYVTATTANDGDLVADISCLQPFGEQIQLTVTSRDNPEAKATCLVEYKQQFNGYDLTFTQDGKTPTVDNSKKMGTVFADYENEKPLNIVYAYNKSDVYTVAVADDEITAPATLTIEYKSSFATSINGVKASSLKIPVITNGNKSFTVSGLFDKTFIAGFTAAQINSITAKIKTYKANIATLSLKDESGNILTTYSLSADTTAIDGVARVENLTLDDTTLTFGKQTKTFKINYKCGNMSKDTYLFVDGSEYGLSKVNGGNYPESYTYGEAVTISALKSSFNCGGPGSNYHSGSGSGKAGYAFRGWYLDNRCTVPFDGTIPAGTYGDITLYADITATYTHNY